MANQIFFGTFVHTPALDQIEYLHDTIVAVEATGVIFAIEELPPIGRHNPVAWIRSSLLPNLGWAADTAITATRPGQFFFPGFIGASPPPFVPIRAFETCHSNKVNTDTHLHASQYPNVGIFGKSTLLDWLNKYTFPLEASLHDLAKARRVYGRCIRKTLSHGTTTAAYYATVDVAATNLLADLCLQAGQRALVGRVCMDEHAFSPDYYRDETPEEAEAATRVCMDHIARIDPKHTLLRPVLTPRFAPSCTGDLMGRLGRLHKEGAWPIQTHISENTSEVALVKDLFKGIVPPSAGEADGLPSYAGVYDHFGLLTPQTILAHGVHLTEAEASLIRERGSKVSHCPCSNSAITSGAARVRWLLERGIEVGLGTDMSGGYSPSILEAARLASMVSRHVAMGGDDAAKLSVEEVLFLGTVGGAHVVGMGDRLGLFRPGMLWDAQLVGLALVDASGNADVTSGFADETTGAEADASLYEEEGNVDVFGWETWEDRIAKWLFNGDDRNTKKVWVNGRLVHDRSARAAQARATANGTADSAVSA
ncbi:guanine deaminase [Sporothrix brasiliensis 5110]|uniref:Guanine deaminase n=1 Tax=Sporothrix brasiliensis 5110 TaxID=1398154 RepID=A0A0C2ER69_9PEZI|nr:guanine deaminase [Sporothrix brasiliensis 5110]KIH88859.1 guanine deaminase [Sporothrix brasiliensis 5110]